jgi:tRNA A-37 threonylcarbamoyl transferase component Bud32
VSEASGPRQSDLDSALAKKVLKDGLVTPEQLRDALLEQHREQAKGKSKPLGAILTEKGYLKEPRPKALKEPAAFGKYRLLRELGRGGMGVVYEAEDVALHRKVALKTMIPHAAADPKEAKNEEERFLREARLAASLPKHPHIVGVYEAGVIEGRRYIAMELIQGEPLSDWRARETGTPREEVELLRDAALAVHHAHERGIIHRDLKPQNILVDAKHAPHITDFGLAKMVGQDLSVSLTGAGLIVGTPAYISPEQAQGLKSTDRRTDVYALGVILFETLTGRQPFQGETAMEILMKAAKNPVPLPSSLMKIRVTPAQARGLEVVCLKALQKNPKDRYPDAAAFAADLTRWLRGDEVKSQIRTRRLARPAARRWSAAAAIGAAVVLAAVLAALLRPGGPSAAERERVRAEEERRAREARDNEERLRKMESELKAMKAQVQPALVHRDPRSLRPGAVGEYFSGSNFEIPCLRRVDERVAFPGKDSWSEVPAEFISFRWSGFIDVPASGSYTFQATGPDGARLFVDDVEVFSHWKPRPPGSDAGIALLEKGLHRVVLERFQSKIGGGLDFTWKESSDAGPARTGLLHDPSKFTPLSRKPSWEHIDWDPLPGAQEAESLPILFQNPDATFVLPFGRKKGLLVWGRNTKVNDVLRLRFNAERPRATLALALGRSKNAGIVSVSLNGRTLAPKLDLYQLVNHTLEVEFKVDDLKVGPNELEFVMVGTNPAAVEWKKGDGLYKMSLDYVRLR